MKKAQTYLRSSKIALTLLGLSGVLLTSSLPAMGSSYQEGVALYNKGKFNEALAVFNQVSSTGHEDANVVYYSGLCHHQLRDFKQAKACYQKVLQAYPNSSVKGQAQTALSAFYRSGGSGSASSSSSGSGGGGHIVDDEEDGRIDLSRCPPSSRLYYKDTENTAGIAFMVKVSVNNRPIEWYSIRAHPRSCLVRTIWPSSASHHRRQTKSLTAIHPVSEATNPYRAGT